MFPRIEHINDLLPHIADKPEIRVMKQENGTTVVCYLISSEDTFSGPSLPYLLECRGITFDADGKTIARPFEKFFNVGERPDTQIENLIWKNVSLKMDKRDGSMITPVLINGEVVCKSKKAFTSDVAVAATKFIHKPENKDLLIFIKILLLNNLTGCFEWTSPSSRIVLNYREDDLTLLCVRHNFTGEYVDLSMYSHGMPGAPTAVKIVDIYDHRDFDITAVQEYLATAEGIEGYVIQLKDEDGNVKHVKLKGAWYLMWHHVVTFPTWRSLAKMVVAEATDDYKSYLTNVGASHEYVLQVEKAVVNKIAEIELAVAAAIAFDGELPRKDFAIKHNGHEYFGLFMTRYSGKEPDVKGYFEKHLLKEMFSTEQVPSDAHLPLEDEA